MDPGTDDQPSPIPNVPMLILVPWVPTNYEKWREHMADYLRNQGLFDVVEPTSVPRVNEAWKNKNDKALNTIRSTCHPFTVSSINDICSAHIAWETLAKMYEVQKKGEWIELYKFKVNFGDLSELSKPALVRMAQTGAICATWHFDVDNKRFSRMYAAINRGNWKDLKVELEADPTALTAKVSSRGHMLIHLAAMAGHEQVTEELAELMHKIDLEIQDSFGATALTYASGNGMTKTIERLLSLNNKLLYITDIQDALPIFGASIRPHYQTTRYLYSRTPIAYFYPQNGYHGYTLLCNCIISGLFDVALDLIRRCPDLTISQDFSNSSPFLTLGTKASEFHSSNLKFWKRWIYSLIHIQVPKTLNDDFRIQGSQLSQISPGSRKAKGGGLVWYILKLLGVKQIYEMKWMHVYALEILGCMCQQISSIKDSELPSGIIENALTEAISNGIFEFVIEIVKACPHPMYYVDIFGRHMIMAAVSYRQEKIYSLIYGLDSEKTNWIGAVDNFGNNMLHLAGMLAPPSRLARISGAALQMQRELQWFKEVETIVQPHHKNMRNMDGETPEQVFENNHKQLVGDAEKWMKDTATSCTVVGALIITIMFAAIFTVPTGNNLENIKPSFSYRKSYLVFIISDSISLFASSTSVLMFLGILTSRYAQEDFLKSLPTKLIIGLSTLFFSIVSMMVSFCATLMIMLQGQLHLVVPIILLASLPGTLFMLLQFPLLVEIFIYTYGPGIFDKSRKGLLNLFVTEK